MFINKPSIVKYTVAGNTVFPFEFKFYRDTDIKVWYVPPGENADDELHLLVLGTDYTISSDASQIGGSVTVSKSMLDGGLVTIARVLPTTRTIDYADRGAFKAQTMDEDQDYQTYLMLDQLTYSNFFLRSPISGDGGTSISFPEPFPEAYIRWNVDGTAIINDLEPAVWRTETEAFRNETLIYRDEVEIFRDDSEDFNGEALASSLNALQWANAPVDTDVIEYTWDTVNDVMTEAPLVNARSAYHWQSVAKFTASGLTFQSTWDLVDCILPPTPTPPAGDLANGYFYIIQTVSGDQSACPNAGVGDWLIWSGDLDGDGVVEGSWELLNWEFDWSAIEGVTVSGQPTAHGQDLLSTTGGTMTAQLKGITPVAVEDLTRKDYVDATVKAKIGTSYDEYGGSIDDFINVGVFGITFDFGTDYPSRIGVGALTVTTSEDGGTVFITQQWQTYDEVFYRHKQGTTWSAWANSISSKPNVLGTGTTVIRAMVQCSLAEYTALAPVEDVLYIVTDDGIYLKDLKIAGL